MSFRGPGERATGGHPDVIAWRGNRTVFVEYKSPSDGDARKQAGWVERAKAHGLITPDSFVIARSDVG